MAKRARTGPPQPQDLLTGAVVLYNGDCRGIISDAYASLDEFWLIDEKTNDPVRADDGSRAAFRAADLELAPPLDRPPSEQGVGGARVLIIGVEDQMLQILENFGQPDATERKEPQQLLAVPCSYCACGPSGSRFDYSKRVASDQEDCPLLELAKEGIDEAMYALARRLRPDIEVGVRAHQLKQAVEQLGPDLKRLEGHYCLSAVTLPYGQEDIKKKTGAERIWMRDVRNQIDLGVTSEAFAEAGEKTLEETAKRSLGEACGLCVSDHLWSEEAQKKVRKDLGIDMPLKVWDGEQTKVFLLVLPSDAKCSSENGLLTFSEAVLSASVEPSSRQGEGGPGGKTIGQWKEDQEQFKGMPKLPEGWIRIRSRTNPKEIYYWNTRTSKPSYEIPLPEGWTKQKSKTTGQVYYFNAKKRKSTFDVPTE